MREMLKEVNPDRIRKTVSTLVGFGTRHTLSQQNSSTRGIGAARDWIYDEMLKSDLTRNDRNRVYLDSYIQDQAPGILFPVNLTNVVGMVRGTEDPKRVYVVTAHYDSRALDPDDHASDAPGADDNASGVAVVMEMFRICAKRQPRATMIFAATAGEEQGSYGATHLASSLTEAGYNIGGNWNNDIVGTGNNAPYEVINGHTIRVFGASIFYPNSSTAAEETSVAAQGGWNDSPSQNLGRFIAEVATGAWNELNMQVALIYRPDRIGRGGDHESFLAQGWPAIRFTESVEDFAHQHQDPRIEGNKTIGDLLEFVDYDYTARVARVNLASMWAAANAPALPKEVKVSENVGQLATSRNTPLEDMQNEIQLTWMVGKDALADHYEIVYRPSGELQWSHSVVVGNAGSTRLQLSKDNFQIGLRAVGADGLKSPAVNVLPPFII
ncbi:hypothetical protein LTR49_027874 [Elasticomyces elasticus]|nr:hypothetical protein LTR49_027874 [Elasticomyces elasticus]